MIGHCGLYFRVLTIVIYGKFNSKFPEHFQFFLPGLSIVQFFSLFLLVSRLYGLSLCILFHISEMSRRLSMNLYFRPYSVAIYGKCDLYCLHIFRFFFLIDKLYQSDLKILCFISRHLRFIAASVDIAGFSSGILRRVSFNFQLVFLTVLFSFLVCKF